MSFWGRTNAKTANGTAKHIGAHPATGQTPVTGLERARYERQNDAPPPQSRASAPPVETLAASSMQAAHPPPAKPRAIAGAANGAELYAGAGLKLKGEISDCDSFRVEGEVDARVAARRLFVSASGVFNGTAEVEDAEIEGRVDGTLVVSGKLILRGTGRLAGNVSYGEIEIECGGEITGEIMPGKARNGGGAKSAPVLVHPAVRSAHAPDATPQSNAARKNLLGRA